MKRQILIIVSVALVSFLVGTIASMGLTAFGIIPNPFVNLANTSESQVKVVRFSQPNEINVTARIPTLYNLTDFVWTPKNPQNNFILAVHGYCEYRIENVSQAPFDLDLGIKINELELRVLGVTERSTDWKLVTFSVQVKGLWMNPNQDNYTIGFGAGTFAFVSWSIPKYVRNINIIMEVIDG